MRSSQPKTNQGASAVTPVDDGDQAPWSSLLGASRRKLRDTLQHRDLRRSRREQMTEALDHARHVVIGDDFQIVESKTGDYARVWAPYLLQAARAVTECTGITSMNGVRLPPGVGYEVARILLNLAFEQPQASQFEQPLSRAMKDLTADPDLHVPPGDDVWALRYAIDYLCEHAVGAFDKLYIREFSSGERDGSAPSPEFILSVQTTLTDHGGPLVRDDLLAMAKLPIGGRSYRKLTRMAQLKLIRSSRKGYLPLYPASPDTAG